jgi:hypothetical protein
LRDGEYSLHHILPYRYPLFTGFLAQAYATKFDPNNRNWPGGSMDPIAMQTTGIHIVLSRFGSTQHDLPSQFAWMGPNLFQGSSGNFRIDDPGSSREPRKPISYKQDRWDALQQAGDRIDGLVSSWGSDNQRYTATTAKTITVGDFEDLLKLLRPIAQVGHGNAHAFQETDWIVLSTSDPTFGQYLRPNATVSNVLKAQFESLASREPKKVKFGRPSYSGMAFPRNPVPHLWRLRQPMETVPTDMIIGPRLQ